MENPSFIDDFPIEISILIGDFLMPYLSAESYPLPALPALPACPAAALGSGSRWRCEWEHHKTGAVSSNL